MPATPLVLPTVIDRATLLARGVSDAEIRAHLAGRDWSRVARGHYSPVSDLDPLGPEQRHAVTVRAELGAHGPDGVMASHLSAAALFDLPVVGASLDRVELIRDAATGGRVTRRCHVRAARVPAEDRAFVHGAATTSAARTVVDVGRTRGRDTAVALADAALQRGLVSPEQVAEAFSRLRSTRGAPTARRHLAMVDGRAESPGESLLRLRLATGGFTDVDLQVRVLDEDGHQIARCDGALPGYGIALEFDGEVKYGRLLTPGRDLHDVVLAEKRRESALVELGWLVLRVVWRDLHRPATLVDRVRRAVAARRRTGWDLRGSHHPSPPLTIPQLP